MQILRWVTAAIAAFVFGICVGEVTGDDPNYWETDRLYVTYMGATWCGPCRIQKPMAKRLAQKYGLPFTEFDIDTTHGHAALEKAQSLTGRSIPIVTICRRGIILEHIVGQTSESQLSSMFERHGAGQVPVLKPSGTAGYRTVRELVQEPRIERWQNTPWGNIDLETYSRPGCSCPMCQAIWALQARYRQPAMRVVEKLVPHDGVLQEVEAPNSEPAVARPEQEPSPEAITTQSIDASGLTASDTLADLGCGDARVLIAAVRATGCRAIGVEIDPFKAAEARKAVEAAGMSEKITILTGDAREFDLVSHGVTVVFCYLWEDLLAEIGKNISRQRVVSPYHPIPGLKMHKHGAVWVAP